ncbi:MAG TPA: CopG family transcriptional regulator [Vicinamibacterales bacterium]|nr:CopG family transcriptional regulator [Vicinamibacterales bacterium]
MKRTTVYFEPDLELMLERESRRRGLPMAALVREAVRAYLADDAPKGPPGAGAFASGRAATARDTRAALKDTGFGEPD